MATMLLQVIPPPPPRSFAQLVAAGILWLCACVWAKGRSPSHTREKQTEVEGASLEHDDIFIVDAGAFRKHQQRWLVCVRRVGANALRDQVSVAALHAAEQQGIRGNGRRFVFGFLGGCPPPDAHRSNHRFSITASTYFWKNPMTPVWAWPVRE